MNLQSTSLKSLYFAGIFDVISVMRVNTNGYPFVTLIRTAPNGGKSKSTNIYFGKASSELILNTFEIGDSVLKAVIEADVVLTENSAGEKRFKISLPKADRKYESSSAMADAFGNREDKEVNFDFDLFKAEFAAAEVTNIPEGA